MLKSATIPQERYIIILKSVRLNLAEGAFEILKRKVSSVRLLQYVFYAIIYRSVNQNIMIVSHSLTCRAANLVLDYSTKWHQLPCMDSKYLFTHSSNSLQRFPPHCTDTNRVNFNTGGKQASCRPFHSIVRLSGCQNNEDPSTSATWPASKEIPLSVSQGSS